MSSDDYFVVDKGEGVKEENEIAILYTSGSTGEPKGVRIPESGVLNRLKWYWTHFPFHYHEVCAMRTPLTFGDSIAEILSPLLKGVRIAIVPESLLVDPLVFLQKLSVHKVTRIVLIPSLLNMLLDFVDKDGVAKQKFPSSLQLVTTSGEELTFAIASKFFTKQESGATLLDMYGCTEVMADVTCQPFCCVEDVQTYSHNGRLAIGSLVDNTTAVLRSNPEGDDDAMELTISGPCVAIGYIESPDSPELSPNTESKFFHHPQHGWSFRTGDLVKRFRPSNSHAVLIFAGRCDSQRKINGQKVNLSQVADAMKRQLHVEPVVVFDYERQKVLAPKDCMSRSQTFGGRQFVRPREHAVRIRFIGLPITIYRDEGSF